ncbi:hypothetical protein SCHPADRAFT_892039 [Schizopora paradoxa]|uniref:Uncharacterized protein n=1 Tax=Schizopora paradoxa TaxID=27342 RepID=A0A0H2RG78_9AGAM|nr:hypothetical protein SCHPADRAFT_892039 [Schizopora paradoxa]
MKRNTYIHHIVLEKALIQSKQDVENVRPLFDDYRTPLDEADVRRKHASSTSLWRTFREDYTFKEKRDGTVTFLSEDAGVGLLMKVECVCTSTRISKLLYVKTERFYSARYFSVRQRRRAGSVSKYAKIYVQIFLAVWAQARIKRSATVCNFEAREC